MARDHAWPWLAARRVELFRRRARRDLLNDPLDDDSEWLAASDYEAADARRDVAKLLETLPDRHRLPIVHVKLEGLSVAARLTGMSESAVKIGVHRGLKALARRVRGESRGPMTRYRCLRPG